MSAPNLETLYAFEEAVEPIVVAALTALGVPAYRLRDTTTTDTPRVEVSLWMGAATNRMYAPIGALYAPGETYFSAFHARLITAVVTNRLRGSTNGGRHAEFIGKCRLIMLQARRTIADALEHHQINLIKDTGIHPTQDRDANLDISPLIHDMQIEIRADAWPVAQA